MRGKDGILQIADVDSLIGSFLGDQAFELVPGLLTPLDDAGDSSGLGHHHQSLRRLAALAVVVRSSDEKRVREDQNS